MFDKFWGRGTTFATRDSVIYLFNGFKFLGIYPPTEHRVRYAIYSALINISVTICLPLALCLSYFIESKRMEASKLLTSLQVGINICGLPFKIITVAMSLKRLQSAEGVMDKLDARCHESEELAKIHKSVVIGNRLVALFTFAYGSGSVSTFLCSAAMGQPPYSIYMPFIDWMSSMPELCFQSLIEFILMSFACCHQAVDDVYAVIYIYILRTHMQLLVERVRRLGSESSKNKDENYEELVECIVDHKNILELVNIISPVISITIFVQFVITAAILGTTMINIFVFADTSAQIASVFYFLCVLVQISPCCYQATCLMDDSDELPLAIWQCNWMNEDVHFRKMLIFFMQRAQKPMTLTAMKLFPIALNTNLSIAKFSFSLYTLIKEMDFGQNLKN